MPLPVLTFNQFLTNFTNTLVSNTPKITNLTPGSVAFALGQAAAAISISIQQLIVHVANITRLATSYGADVDSWLADYGLTRLPAVSASGTIWLTRAVSGAQLVVPVTGAICQTQSSQIQFQLFADVTQPNYNATLNAYVFNASDLTISATVQAVTPGTGSNILANLLTQIVSGFAGVNSITNLVPFTNGQNVESDAAAKIRFVEFISSLAECTEGAIEFTIRSVQTGLTFQLIENKHFDGSAFPGGFIVVVDDGSGMISPTLLQTIFNAILPNRAAGISFQVFAPTDVTVNSSVSISVGAGFNPAAVLAQVQANMTAFINNLGVGVTCGYVAMGTIIQATPGVAEYSGLTLNSGTSDVPIALTELARAGSVTVVLA